jgi:hypothetical protein
MTKENALAEPLLGGANFFVVILLRHRPSSFLFRVRLRRLFRALRLAALWCWGVGDDVEIVGGGFHDGSSFC